MGSVNGFVASPITYFTLMTYSGHSGVIDSISYPPINDPGHWVPEYGMSAFLLKAVM